MKLALKMLALFAMFAIATSSTFKPPDRPSPMSCKYDTTLGASYDLTKLQELSKDKPLEVVDRLQVAEKDFLYTLGICTTVAPPKNCQLADGDSRVTPYWAPAWQTNRSQTEETTPNINDRGCYYLGAGSDEYEEFAKWSPLDPENPGAGVSLKYTRGQHCSNGQRRALILNFVCSREGIEKIDKNVMDEAGHCEYEITIESEYACPTECGWGGGQTLCNNHGVCGYDTDAKAARCFCNEGYDGPGCDEKQDTPGLQGYGPILGLLIFVTVAIVGLVGAVLALFRFMSKRTVPLDGESYARLDGDMDSFTPMRMDVKGPESL